MDEIFDGLMQAILEILPNATIGEDNDGQLVIYTDVSVTADGQLVPLD
jgi:hypothetical protein